MASLTGKNVLITGGARRIGKEIALAMANAGANVGITFRTSQKEATKTVTQLARLGVRSLAVHCDVREEKSVDEAIAEFARKMSRLDVLVNNAAIYETVDFKEITVAQWDNIFAINTRGPFLVSRAAYPLLRKRRGRIVNLGSLGGLRSWTTHAHYSISKTAVHALTGIMAKTLAPEISVNCVAPGMIEVGRKSLAGRGAPQLEERLAARTPMGRNGSAADVASAVLYFSTCPKYITGQILVVDGGLGLM